MLAGIVQEILNFADSTASHAKTEQRAKNSCGFGTKPQECLMNCPLWSTGAQIILEARLSTAISCLRQKQDGEQSCNFTQSFISSFVSLIVYSLR